MGDVGEETLHREEKVIVKDIKIWSWAPLRARLKDELVGRPSVAI
jgi:hypothetical protein